MSILKDVLTELFGMFVSDARLSAAILAVVAIAATLIRIADVPLAGGAALLLGCLAVLVESVRRDARRRRARS